MFLGALLDAGLAAEELLTGLRSMPLGEYDFRISQVLRGGLAGTYVEIVIPESQPHRHLRHVEEIIEGGALPVAVKQKALDIFRRLAEAEGKLHQKPAAKVHFHEVGAVDAILDIAGACLGLELLGIDELVSSPLNVGGGLVEAAHGTLPVPAPATAELLKGVPVYSSGLQAELVTPTGAAIVTTLARSFGPVPPMKIERVGYGAGSGDFRGQPNLARIMIGERVDLGRPDPSAEPVPGQMVSVIEASIDDMSPQLYGYFVEKALAAGALDVTSSAVQMKKNRPGLLVTVLSLPDQASALAELLFRETTTIGLRIHEARRQVLEREWASVETAYGPVRIKVASREGRVMNAAPEYEDCQRLAEQKGVPLKEVMQAAQAAYREDRPEGRKDRDLGPAPGLLSQTKR